MKTASTNNPLSCIEYPTKFFLTSAKHGLGLSVGPEGLTTTRNRQSWGVWRLLEDPDNDKTVVLQSVDHKVFLCYDKPGNQVGTSQTGGMARMISWELYRVHNGGEDVDGAHVRLRSCASMQLLSCSADGTLGTQCPDKGADVVWKLEFLTGELCFLSNPSCDRRLYMDSAAGSIDLTTRWESWGVWRFITLGKGQFLITVWARGLLLASNHEGGVFSTRDRGDLDCRWTVAKSKSNQKRVTIESTTHRRFLCVPHEGKLCTSDRADHHGNTWNVESSNRSVFYITSCDSQWVLCSNQHGNVYSTGNRASWEQWKVLPIEGGYWGKFNIVSCSHGRYLGSTDEWHLRTLSCPGHQEVWKIKKDRVEGYVITSNEYDMDLDISCDGNVLATNSHDRGSHNLKLETSGFDGIAMLTTRVTTVDGETEERVELDDVFSPLLTM